jgi:electron transfer flavoprotein beta subunit
MNVIACYKWVLDEADLVINDDLSVNTSRAAGKISEYDRNALQAGVEAAAEGDEVVALTYGTADAQKSLKDALSRGPSRVVCVKDPSASAADGAGTAKVLAAAIQKIGGAKLVICAEGASDTYSHEVGPRLGILLNLPVISNVDHFSIDGSLLTATRVLDEQIETVQVELPAVITILPEAAPAPIPSLKMVLGAAKKPVNEFSLAELGLSQESLTPKTKLLDMRGFAMNRKNIVFAQGSPAELVNQLVGSLVREGVLA